MKLNTAQQVESILRHVPMTRNSDTELLLVYMHKAGIELTESQKAKFREMPAPETITRFRRKLQEQGKYEASPEVNEARYNKFKQYKETIVLPWGEG